MSERRKPSCWYAVVGDIPGTGASKILTSHNLDLFHEHHTGLCERGCKSEEDGTNHVVPVWEFVWAGYNQTYIN